jgi:hypothetical protein
LKRLKNQTLDSSEALRVEATPRKTRTDKRKHRAESLLMAFRRGNVGKGVSAASFASPLIHESGMAFLHLCNAPVRHVCLSKINAKQTFTVDEVQ